MYGQPLERKFRVFSRAISRYILQVIFYYVAQRPTQHESEFTVAVKSYR